jgi:hypothetical protein
VIPRELIAEAEAMLAELEADDDPDDSPHPDAV